MIHFQVSRFFGAFKDTYGVALPQEAGLRLSFHSEDEDEVDVMDTEVREILIPWKMIQGLKEKKGLFESEIDITLSRLFRHDKLTISGHVMTLDIRKKERDRIEPFIHACEKYRAGVGGDDIDTILDDTQNFLDDL